jgi:nitronate monooxygenase
LHDNAHRTHRCVLPPFGLSLPILLPMAGACPPELAAAVASAGGMGAMGALLTSPAGIVEWTAAFRARSNGAFQINLGFPIPPPSATLSWKLGSASFSPPGGRRCRQRPRTRLRLTSRPKAQRCSRSDPVSSIMGLYPPAFVAELKARGIAWFACATTLAEALAAETAGADAIVAQGPRPEVIAARSMQLKPSNMRLAYLHCYPASLTV